MATGYGAERITRALLRAGLKLWHDPPGVRINPDVYNPNRRPPKAYTPQTNGKAERFIQTALREWAYATAFETSQQRRAELPDRLHRYNWNRLHASLHKPPISRLG